jgi:F-type H+-transporting ATPase subunit delta
MANDAAARRYAKALFELSEEAGRVDALRQELGALGRLLEENTELASVLLEPLHPATQRRSVLEGVVEKIDASPVLRSFYSFLIDQRRLVDFASIEQEFGRLADIAAGLTVAKVRSANPLSDDQQARLERALTVRSGRKVTLELEVDPTLLGGLVAQVGDTVFDGSLTTQLNQLRAGLAK